MIAWATFLLLFGLSEGWNGDWGPVVEIKYMSKGRVSQNEIDFLKRQCRLIFGQNKGVDAKTQQLKDLLSMVKGMEHRVEPDFVECTGEWCDWWLAFRMVHEVERIQYVTIMARKKKNRNQYNFFDWKPQTEANPLN